jgi:hypothetical protein
MSRQMDVQVEWRSVSDPEHGPTTSEAGRAFAHVAPSSDTRFDYRAVTIVHCVTNAATRCSMITTTHELRCHTAHCFASAETLELPTYLNCFAR